MDAVQQAAFDEDTLRYAKQGSIGAVLTCLPVTIVSIFVTSWWMIAIYLAVFGLNVGVYGLRCLWREGQIMLDSILAESDGVIEDY
jgi:hypothetical protein